MGAQLVGVFGGLAAFASIHSNGDQDFFCAVPYIPCSGRLHFNALQCKSFARARLVTI